jgi:hypothetical protein
MECGWKARVVKQCKEEEVSIAVLLEGEER